MNKSKVALEGADSSEAFAIAENQARVARQHLQENASLFSAGERDLMAKLVDERFDRITGDREKWERRTSAERRSAAEVAEKERIERADRSKAQKIDTLRRRENGSHGGGIV